jgi:GntR family transcriptional repressor for pyruvate dehydrogenase complex
MKFDAIQIHSAPEALAQQIVAQIVSGELKPGSCLPSQRQLAKMFSVGLGSVREAVKILNALGYLNVIRGKGTFVSQTPMKTKKQSIDFHQALEAVSVADLMKARELVECEVASLAAREADAQNIRHLKRITNNMEASFNDTQTFYALDFDFHIGVAEAANNKALFEIVKLLVDKAHNYIGFMDNPLGISMPFNVEKAVATARNIVHYIEAGDGENAREEMYRHLNIVNFELEKEFLGAKS